MKFLSVILVTVGLLFSTVVSAFPNKPVKIVTNLPIGSGPDIFVRKLGQTLEAKYSVPVVIENKPGGAGLVALEHYLTLPADGHSIFYGDFGIFVSTPTLYNRDNLLAPLKPLTIGYNSAWMIVTPASIKNFSELKQALQANPNYGSWGVGSGGHLCGSEISSILGVTTAHVPYREQGQWFVDITNSVFPFGCTSVGSSEAFYKTGKFNYVATTANQRDPAYPNVPTVKELTGHTFQTGEVFSAFYIHAGTSNIVSTQLEKDLREIIQSAALVDLVKNLRGYPASNTSQQMGVLQNQRLVEYRSLIKKYNIKID